MDREYIPTNPDIWKDGHPHIGDDNIRAIMEGPFLAYRCASEADALELDMRLRAGGTYSILYRVCYVVFSVGQVTPEEVFRFIEGLKLSSRPERIAVSGSKPNQLSECLVVCWSDYQQALEKVLQQREGQNEQ